MVKKMSERYQKLIKDNQRNRKILIFSALIVLIIIVISYCTFYMISKNKGIGLMPEKFFRLQPYPNIKIVPLKEQVFRTLVIAWDENTSLSKQAINFLQFTKNWFENI